MADTLSGPARSAGQNYTITLLGTGEEEPSIVVHVNNPLGTTQMRIVWKEFEEKPGTGYIWRVSAPPDVRYSYYYSKSPNDRAMGRGHTVFFSFTTENPQPQQVTLRLQRPWGGETLETKHFYI